MNSVMTEKLFTIECPSCGHERDFSLSALLVQLESDHPYSEAKVGRWTGE